MRVLDRIRFHAGRGMAHAELVRIYGLERVMAAKTADDTPPPFHIRLLAVRTRRSMTVKAAADELSLVQGHLSMIENGRRVPTGDALIKRLAVFMDEDADALHRELEGLAEP